MVPDKSSAVSPLPALRARGEECCSRGAPAGALQGAVLTCLLRLYNLVVMELRMHRHLLSKVFLWECHRLGLQSQVQRSRRLSALSMMEHTLGKAYTLMGESIIRARSNKLRDKLYRKDERRYSFVKNYGGDMTKRTFMCKEGGKEFTASSGLLQHQPPGNVGKLYRDTTGREAFQNGQNDYKCTQCGKAFSHKYPCHRQAKPLAVFGAMEFYFPELRPLSATQKVILTRVCDGCSRNYSIQKSLVRSGDCLSQ
ncbi:hypothetical protein MC885_016024 [Smutsia gigantea]|nr:hypothetical protein MC885_016024 [Smutsia gigantea]